MSKLKARKPETVSAGRTKALIFGASGVGKTWFCLDFPAPYYIDCEAGAKQDHYRRKLQASGGAYMGPEDGALDFSTVIDQFQALSTEKHGFKTVIIDSVTKLYQIAIAHENERIVNAGKKDEFGASKKPAVAGMRRLINWVSRCDLNVWFVAHEGIEWGLDGTTGQRSEIGKIPDAWDKLTYELDLSLHATRRGDSRYATVRKSRLAGFPDREEFPLDFKEFAQRFGAEAIDRSVALLTLAAKEQVDEISRLLSVLQVPETETEKILTRASASTWAELTTEQAAATINWLKNKLTGKAE